MYYPLPSLTIFPIPSTRESSRPGQSKKPIKSFGDLVSACLGDLRKNIDQFMQKEWEFSRIEENSLSKTSPFSRKGVLEIALALFKELSTCSKTLKKERGLPNLHFSCYLNSVIQVFQNLLFKEISLEQLSDLLNQQDPSAKELFKMTFLMLLFAMRHGTEKFLFKALKNHFNLCFIINQHPDFNLTNYAGQKDANSYLELWHEMMEDHFIIESIVTGIKEDKLIQSNPTQTTQKFIYVDMLDSKILLERLNKKLTLKELILLNFSSPNLVQAEKEPNVFDFDGYKTSDFKIERRFVKPPDHLTVRVARSTLKGKIATPLNLGFKPDKEIIDLSPFCLHGQKAFYQLAGAIKHKGETMLGGHYLAAVKKEDWKIFDDKNIKLLKSESNFLEKSYLYFFKLI